MAGNTSVAVVSDTVENGLNQVRHMIEPVSYSVSKRTGKFTDGRNFFIATQIEHLAGKRVGSVLLAGYPDAELIAYARTRQVGAES